MVEAKELFRILMVKHRNGHFEDVDANNIKMDLQKTGFIKINSDKPDLGLVSYRQHCVV
jgi:hypothetical protein